MKKAATALAVVLFLEACSTNPAVNDGMVLTRPSRDDDYTFANWLKAREKKGPLPETLVFLTFSGGGARASATSLGVLELLDGNERLKGSIALISSTSGGSVTAATYAAEGKSGLANLNDNFLRQKNMGPLTARLLPRMLVPGANRATAFATYLDEKLFPNQRPTYAQLRGKWHDAPFIVLNATDMSSGRSFEFTQESFSEICSDLNKFPLTDAVAASASFPFLLNPMPLRNHWANAHLECAESLIGEPASKALERAEEGDQKYMSPERLARAQYAYALEKSYVGKPKPGPAPDRNIQYLHLLDGGLSDNLAARSVMRILGAHLKYLQDQKVANIVIVQVNAKSLSKQDYDKSGAIPNWLDVFWSVTLNPIDVATELSAYASRLYTAELASTTVPPKRDGTKINVITMPVDFALLDQERRLRAQAIKTDWSLGDATDSPDALTFLKDVAKELLEQNPCYKVLKEPGSARCQYATLAKGPESPPGPTVAFSQPPTVAAAPASPPPSSPPKPSDPVPAPTGEKATFAADAFFDFDKSMLKPEATAKLDDLAMKTRNINLEVIIVVGHTDSVGSDAYNQKLSIRRSEAVKAYLVSKGVEPDRVYTEGKGEKQPVADNKTAEGRSKNRRVEIEVVGTRVR